MKPAWEQKSPLEWELQGTSKRISWDRVVGKEAMVVEDDDKESCVLIPLDTLADFFEAQGIELQKSADMERASAVVSELFIEQQQANNRIAELETEVGRKWEQCRSLLVVHKQNEKAMAESVKVIDTLRARLHATEIALGSERDEKTKIVKIAADEIERLRKLIP